MDLVIAWLIGPAALLAIAIGLSLLIERLADLTVPWTIRPALGLCAAIVVAQFMVVADETAELAVPAIVVLAALGLLIGWGQVDSRPSPWAIGAALLVFFVFAAPFIAYGAPTWGGYIKLDDTGTFMGIVDHTFEFGRGVGNLAPSTHEAMISDLGGNYPTGSLVAMATMSRVLDQDPAWMLQPSLAVAAFVLCLLLYELARPILRDNLLAAGVAVLGSLSATLMGYYMWGGVKELMAAALLPLGPALAAHAARRDWPREIWAPIGVSIAAFIAVLGAGGGVWLLPTLLPALVVLAYSAGWPAAIRVAWPALALAVVLALPTLITPDGLLNPLSKNFIENTELGNLSGPLNILHASGIWPSLDFRSDPSLKPAVLAIAVLCLVLAAGAVAVCARSRSNGAFFSSYVGGGAVGALITIAAGSTWVDGKAMAIISPAILAAAGLAIALVWQRTDFRIEAAALAALVGGVTLWGAYLAFHGAWLAPRDHFTELERIGEQFAGDGPALSTEAPSYGPRHFLRKMDAEGATDLRRREVLLVGGTESPKGQYLDLDEIRPDQLDPYETLVIRRGPVTSRPPADFELAYSGNFYEVWQRSAGAGTLVEHLPLGGPFGAGGVPNCEDVARLADEAGADGELLAARVAQPVLVDLDAAEKPASWSSSEAGFIPTGSGTVTATVNVPSDGEYEVWLGGYAFGGVEVSVDGEKTGSERGVPNTDGGYEPLGTATLGAGTHTIELDYDRSILRPGSGAGPFAVGPLFLDSASADQLGTETVSPGDYQELCGKTWDWIEARR